VAIEHVSLLHVEDLLRDPLLGLWDIARRHGGVLLPASLGTVSPGLACGMDAYDMFRMAGFDVDKGEGPPGWVWGLCRLFDRRSMEGGCGGGGDT
jgi:hypothetical protein